MTLSNPVDLKDAVALVTGGSVGIGRAMATLRVGGGYGIRRGDARRV